ncbi:MAG: hypothetical protein ABR616_15845 [Dermatophilaceae bacterium]
MSVNTSRSMNNDLDKGRNDGKFRSATPNRGVAELSSQEARAHLHPEYGYGYQDTAPTKMHGDESIPR